jgi:hypothetical protein
MNCLDTGMLGGALPIPEERSAIALDCFDRCRDTLISSDWLITWTRSAPGIKQPRHGLSQEAPAAAVEPFERLLQGGAELRSLDRARFHQAAAELGLSPALA